MTVARTAYPKRLIEVDLPITDLTDAEKQTVTLILPLSPALLK